MKTSTIVVSFLSVCLTGVQAGLLGRVANDVTNGLESRQSVFCYVDSDCHIDGCNAVCKQVLRSLGECVCP
ncbi:hypothetical protein F4781DRAFT_384854 [Annulohypoxylon bovei var. microspora]|nr:hypothetical protein F4781DRAFT_384854 [Annulohypoxylon bovei var. microspora]